MSVGVCVRVHKLGAFQCSFVTMDACVARIGLCLCEEGALTLGSSWDPHRLGWEKPGTGFFLSGMWRVANLTLTSDLPAIFHSDPLSLPQPVLEGSCSKLEAGKRVLTLEILGQLPPPQASPAQSITLLPQGAGFLLIQDGEEAVARSQVS